MQQSARVEAKQCSAEAHAVDCEGGPKPCKYRIAGVATGHRHANRVVVLARKGATDQRPNPYRRRSDPTLRSQLPSYEGLFGLVECFLQDLAFTGWLLDLRDVERATRRFVSREETEAPRQSDNS